jgi:hypothetical protein
MAIDLATFIRNRSAIPAEELARFAGQWVAWSPDGTHIVAGSSESEEAVAELLESMGRSLEDHVFGYIPRPTEVAFGIDSLDVRFPPSAGGVNGTSPSGTPTATAG